MNIPVAPAPTSTTQTQHEEGILSPPSVTDIGDRCLHCRKCIKECSFLAQHGSPGQLARGYSKDPEWLQLIAYSCSLCNLCTQTCPLDLEPGRMFLDLRKEAVRNKSGSFKQHRKLLNYEKLGGSSLLYFAHMPSECRSIFFPGCALPGARPEQTIQLYLQLKKHIPDLGIMLDCCNKPSHDLGREQFFQNRFLARERLLRSKGITNIITACTNCYQAFSQNSTYLKTTTAYNLLADHGFTPETTFPDMNCTIQDPCTTRFEQKLHCDVRTLTERLKLQVVEMEHSRATTLCCGEGGASGCMKESQAGDWIEKRHKEAMGRPLITYCAGCTSTLQHKGPVFHIVDLLFPEEDTEHIQPTRIVPPRTYWNRLKIKFRLKRILDRPFFM